MGFEIVNGSFFAISLHKCKQVCIQVYKNQLFDTFF